MRRSAAKRAKTGILTSNRAGHAAPYLGPIPGEVWTILDHAWEAPIYIASNFAREFKHEIALTASIGWISNIKPDGRSYSPCWHLTLAGAHALEHLKPHKET